MGYLAFLTVLSAATAPVLPTPDGPYAVGMQRFELTDPARHSAQNTALNVAQAPADTNLCTDELPEALRQAIRSRYPGSVLPSISDFTTMALEPFETIGQQCPAVAAADID